jgi:hypothetical protein
MNIAVVKSDGSTLTIKDSLIRFLVSFISSMILCIGYLISLFTEKRQTLHDFVADTVVIVPVTSNDQNFWQIFLAQSKVIFSSENIPSQSTSTINSKSLEELYELHQKGILTDEEYKNKKEEYLKRL